MAKRKKKGGSTGAKVLIIIVVILLIIVLAVCMYYYLSNQRTASDEELSDYLRLHFIDVGQGDSTLLISPDGETMLIDAGKPSASDAIVTYIENLGIDQLDYLVITHLHDDHYGSAKEVVNEIGADRVWVNGADPDNSSERALFSCFADNGCEVISVGAGYTLSMGEVDIDVVAPFEITDKGGNNDSIVMKVTYGETSFMFTGDAEAKEEEAILAAYGGTLSADLIKSGHHGSSTSSSEAFINAVSPSVAVISCGTGNSYGHPHKSTLDRYASLGIKVYRTDEQGSVVIVSDGEYIMYYQERDKTAFTFPAALLPAKKEYF